MLYTGKWLIGKEMCLKYVGAAFVSELARLFCAVGQGSALESVALKAVFVACSLLLQHTR